jgi:hypothetical protein
MQKPPCATPRATPRESTEVMVRNIGRELAEIEQAIGRCRGDRVAEPRVTGTWMAHLLISSKELLHNLLIDTAQRPRRLGLPHRQPYHPQF